jgi:hypothetical protein
MSKLLPIVLINLDPYKYIFIWDEEVLDVERRRMFGPFAFMYMSLCFWLKVVE